MTYKDIPGWFPEQSAETLTRLIQEHDVKDVLEVGTFLGKSAAFFAGLVEKVTCVDIFKAWPESAGVDLLHNLNLKSEDESFLPQFLKNMDDCGIPREKFDPYVMTSRRAYDLLDNHYDLIYIDASHDYKSVLEDIMLWKDRARRIICGDDYDENWLGVKQAVDELIPDRQVEGRVWYKIME
jgi:hypothetical protein